MLSADQQYWFERACAFADSDKVTQAAVALVGIASPTGDEGPLARAIVNRLRAKGIRAEVQELDDRQANAHAILPGSGGAPSLLLYSPLDTVTSNSAAEDLPWAGPVLRPEMRAEPRVIDGHVYGLGAQNPKGHAACALVALEAIAAANMPLAGDLRLGLGAGGMPTNARPGARLNSGHGAGCEWMMRAGPRPDFAVIAKSGWAVSWEEVGLAWYEVRVQGSHSYVGSRHLLPFRNAIVYAGRIIERLEAWFAIWAETHRSGLVAPQGVVSFIESGWERMPAFTPAMCRFRLDLRLSPRTTVAEAEAALSEQLTLIASELDIDLEWERLVAIPGTTTAPDNAIIKASIEAWEFLEGREHQPTPGLSGATDANILRGFGVPTARIGLPKAKLPDIDFQGGMNIVSIEDMVKLTRHLLYVAVATC